MKLLRHPAYGLSELFRDGAAARACPLCKHFTLAIALDELRWNVEVQ